MTRDGVLVHLTDEEMLRTLHSVGSYYCWLRKHGYEERAHELNALHRKYGKAYEQALSDDENGGA